MSTYCVSFRIADRVVNGQSYESRRERLVENAYDGSDGFWDGTTSFLLVGSNLGTDEFAAKVCRGMSSQHDIVVVFDPADMSMAYFGPAPNPDVLGSFFRHGKKLP